MQKLIKDLQTQSFSHIYLLYGEELYLRDQYAKRLKNALIPEDDTINLSSFSGKGISVNEIIDQAQTMPFFAEHRLIYIQNSGFFKEAQEVLAKYLENVPETAYFIFVEDEIDKRGKLYKAVSKYGRIAEFAKQTEETLKRWVFQKIKQENKQIRSSTMDLFLSKTGTDMNFISQELEKLLTYTLGRDVITDEDVQEVCTERIENKIFDMIGAIAEKQQKKALDLYYDLLTLKEPPMRILFLIARQFNQILQFKELEKQGFPANTIADKLGIRGFIVKNTLRQAAAFSASEARYALETAVAYEHDVKSGKLDDKMAVELIIVEMSRK